MEDGDLLTDGIPEGQPDGTGNQGLEGSGGTVETPVNDGSERPKWMDQLGGDLKDNKALYRFKSTSDAVKSFLELEGKQGSMVSIPGEGSTAEERSRFNARLRGGVDTPDDYDLSSAKLPEGVTLTDSGVAELKKLAFENGWTKEAVVKAVEWDAARQAAAVGEVKKAIATNRKESEAALRTEWGAEYDQNLVLAQKVVTEHGGEGLVRKLKETGLGNDPDMVRMMAKIGKATSESSSPLGGQAASAASVAFPEAAKAQAEYNSRHG